MVARQKNIGNHHLRCNAAAGTRQALYSSASDSKLYCFHMFSGKENVQ
jgi:hypothetical protein